MASKKKKKRPYMAWWALPFMFQEADGIRPIRALMLGYHKASKMGLPSKPDITFFSDTNIDTLESFAFPAKELPKLIASILLCSSEEKLLKRAEMKANLVSSRDQIYREFNTRNMKVIDAIKLTMQHGYNWEVPIETHLSDIHLLKGAYLYWIKKGHTVDVRNFMGIGKDIRQNIPVIVFKKSWKNFTDAMWIWDSMAINLVAGFLFLVKYPPSQSEDRFLSLHELKLSLSNWIQKLGDQDFININLMTNITEIIDEMKIEE
jgi:hypothetical protein